MTDLSTERLLQCQEALGQLQEARAEIQRLRAALQQILDFPYVGTQASQKIWDIARRALEPKP